jgi:hypothetical protein
MSNSTIKPHLISNPSSQINDTVKNFTAETRRTQRKQGGRGFYIPLPLPFSLFPSPSSHIDSTTIPSLNQQEHENDAKI